MKQNILPDVSEKLVTTTLEIISDGVWDWNAITGYVYRSPGWYRMLGYDVDSLDNTVLTWENVIHKDDYERVMSHFEAYIQGKVPAYKVQYRCATKSGGYIWIEDRGRIIEWTDQGQVARMIGAHRDISAEKELLRQSEERTQSLQKIIDDRTQELSSVNAQLEKKVEEVERLAKTDTVTALYNRYFFERKIESEVIRAKRFNEPLSLIAIDIDNFKQLNDTYGHAVGDKVLIALANLILRNIRQVDTASRWGGDELMIILPRTKLSDAALLAEKLRQYIADLDLSDILSNVTSSFGVAQYSVGESSKRFTIRTDGALYQAKEKGRNAVAIAD